MSCVSSQLFFGSLQSQDQSSDSKPWGLRGAQVTMVNKMSPLESQVQISSPIFSLKVGEERAAISCQWPMGIVPVLGTWETLSSALALD